MKNQLPIEYKRSRNVAVVSDDPYSFLILNDLFDEMTIISDSSQTWLNQLNLNATVHKVPTVKSAQSDAGRLLRSKRVIEIISARPDMKVDLYAPVDPPYKINPLRLLMNSPAIAHAYENKRYFRDEFSDLIRMPDYVIRYLNELDKAASYRDLCEELGTESMVLQDEQSSGSKGTFTVHTSDEYIDAVRSLKKKSSGGSIVVSEFIEGDIASLQVCITKYGIFTGGLQDQLIDTPELCNTKLEGVTKWCGGVIGAEKSEIAFHQAREIATIIGSELAVHGYKGIFGVDLILTPKNEVYAIEINARHTGYSALVSDAQMSVGKIPFMLLHLLELANEDYEVLDFDALPSYTPLAAQSYTYMIINNPLETDFQMPVDIQPGIYSYDGDSLTFVKHAYSIREIKNNNQCLIMSRFKMGDTIGSGKRVMKIFTRGNLKVDNGLSPKGKKLVSVVKKHFGFEF
jgi:hypothetical protein